VDPLSYAIFSILSKSLDQCTIVVTAMPEIAFVRLCVRKKQRERNWDSHPNSTPPYSHGGFSSGEVRQKLGDETTVYMGYII
jgi:hypothetical protein